MLHLKCQSESSNFFMYIISHIIYSSVQQPWSRRSSFMFHITTEEYSVCWCFHHSYFLVWFRLWDIKSRSQGQWMFVTRPMFHDLNYRSVPFTLGSSGGSNCTIQSTSGISRPRAATSVHSNVPELALQNSKNVVVRFCCFCFPYMKQTSFVCYISQGLGRATLHVKTLYYM